MLTVGSLFSGIGGFDLGLERAGMRVIWQSEIDPYASAVLAKHWPGVPNHGDVRGINWKSVWPRIPDVICGGFPCQPFSSAGKRSGLADDRYLWPEMLRVIADLKPTWVIGENVTHLDRVALERVSTDLEDCGYEVQTLEIPACAVDANHIRARLWILGHANCDSKSGVSVDAEVAGDTQLQADAERWRGPLGRDATGAGRERESMPGDGASFAEDYAERVGAHDGLSRRMDRLRCLGNAAHPAIAEIIGRAIVSAAR